MNDVTIPELLDGIECLLAESTWHPNSISNDSVINLIEVKGDLIRARKKLLKIVERENNARIK